MKIQYKLIIADDFFIERETAREIIEQSDLPVSIIGEFENGKQAFEFIQNNPVDIVLADIEMPILNGLELLDKINEQKINVDVIFFSLHNRFEYVQRALEMGAFGYVIKPIEAAELIDAFTRLIVRKARIQAEQERLSELKSQLEKVKPALVDNFIRGILTSDLTDESQWDEELSFLNLQIKKDDDFYVSLMEIDGFLQRTKDYSYSEKELFLLKVQQDIHCYFHALGIMTLRLENGAWALLVSRQLLSAERDMSIFDVFQVFIDQMSEREISLSCSISQCMKGLESVRHSFSMAREAMKYKFSLGFGQILDASEIDDTPLPQVIDFKGVQIQIKRIIHSGDSAEVRRYVHELFDMRERTYNKQRIKKLTFAMINALQSAINELNLTVDDIFGPNTVLQDRLQPFEVVTEVVRESIEIIKSACEFVGKEADNNSLVVRRIRNYIEDHYSEKITVQDISDSIYYSPNYLNNLFKKETNQTLLEYLTKVRVEKAKQLLHKPNVKIYKVAEAVGYSQESYFRTVFKRQTGLNPKQYMEKINK